MKYLPYFLPRHVIRALEQKPAYKSLEEIDALLGQVYTPAAIEAFLTTPMQVFAGETALELIRYGEFAPVLAQLARDDEGGSHSPLEALHLGSTSGGRACTPAKTSPIQPGVSSVDATGTWTQTGQRTARGSQ